MRRKRGPPPRRQKSSTCPSRPSGETMRFPKAHSMAEPVRGSHSIGSNDAGASPPRPCTSVTRPPHPSPAFAPFGAVNAPMSSLFSTVIDCCTKVASSTPWHRVTYTTRLTSCPDASLECGQFEIGLVAVFWSRQRAMRADPKRCHLALTEEDAMREATFLRGQELALTKLLCLAPEACVFPPADTCPSAQIIHLHGRSAP